MYHDLKSHFLWQDIKGDILDFISQYLSCQQVKVEHKKQSGLLQPLPIPKWKWECVTIDFITGLPGLVMDIMLSRLLLID